MGCLKGCLMLIKSSAKMTKIHLEFDLEFYREQQNSKIYHMFLATYTIIEKTYIVNSKRKKIYVINTNTSSLAVRWVIRTC